MNIFGNRQKVKGRKYASGLDFLPQPILGGIGVDVPTIKDFKHFTQETRVQYAQSFKQLQKYVFFQRAFFFLRGNRISGDYLEFGCFGARTFRMALSCAYLLGFEDMKFHAFDSFQGLPKPTSSPSNKSWTEGQMKIGQEEFLDIINEHGIYTDKVVTHAGFYGDSLTKEKKKELGESKAGFITVDCDLYESAVTVFSFIEELIQEGTIIYIDDYYLGYRGNPLKGVARAFRDFAETSEFQFAPYENVGHGGKAYIAYK